MSVPTVPMPTSTFAGMATRRVAERLAGPVDVAGDDPNRPEDDERADERKRCQDVEEEQPVITAT